MACDKASGLAAAVSYYGGELPSLVGRDAACPIMAHFGIHDASISEAGARSFATAQPSVETHFYDAGQGFNCDYRGQHDADAAALAWERTMAFFGNAFGLILEGDGMPSIIHYRCNQPLAKAVITCQA